jgi:hypothetical protein
MTHTRLTLNERGHNEPGVNVMILDTIYITATLAVFFGIFAITFGGER